MISRIDTKTKKSWALRAGIGGATALAIVVGGIGLTANAATTALPVYDELDSPNPYSVTEGLVFYKAADMGWIVNVPISGVTSLGYTVADGTSYAPSFQLVTRVDRPAGTQKYTRLVWEPYMQLPAQSANSGTYTNLQDGLWWSGSIGSGPGSQASPQPLNFFKTGGAAGWSNLNVTAIDVHQGTTTDATSVVTKVTFNGNDVALGNPDLTPFNQADIDAAKAPLNSQITALTSQVADLTSQLTDANADITDLQAQLTVKQGQLATAQTQLADAQTELADAQAALGNAQDDNAALLATISAKLDKIADLQDQIDGLQDELQTAQDNADALQAELTSTQADLATSQDDLATSQDDLASTNVTLSSLQDEYAAYKALYTVAKNTNIGDSRVLLVGTPVLNQTVSTKLWGSINTKATNVKYQWYVAGHPVVGATNATYKVPASATGKTVSVRVTGTYKDIVFSVHSNTLTAK